MATILSVILCPPNISGPYSYYLVSLAEALRTGRFALLHDGAAPCNLVDVSNLSHAIELALDNGPADGTRMFVTDDADTTWRCVVESLLPLIESEQAIPRISQEELSGNDRATQHSRHALLSSLKHLVSSEVREAMRKDPFWNKVDGVLRRAVTHMGASVENRLRLSVEGPINIRKVASGRGLNWNLCRQQLRGVRHSSELAKSRLGYKPVYSVPESMQAFRTWYRTHHGMDTAVWPLLAQLY